MVRPAMQTVSATGEDYLEAILRLQSSRGAARVRDLAAELGVHKSTVSATLKHLASRGLVSYSPYELAGLTARGRRIARRVDHVHVRIKRFLTDVLGIGEETAAANACRMEHVADPIVVERLWQLSLFASEQGDAWVRQFAQYARQPRVEPERARRIR